ncbi:MAG: sensor hybrid histidine kinase [Deltaproteobacteria bacterium]|nr:sensor hybrid histidine kinase [Deltaproteobacteria bacterium]
MYDRRDERGHAARCIHHRARESVGIMTDGSSAAQAAVLEPAALERVRLLAPMLFGAMVGWFVILELAAPIAPMVEVGWVLIASLVGILALVARRPAARGWGHLLLTALWCAPVVSTLTADWSAPTPLYTMLLTMEMVGAVALLDTRWLLGAMIAVQAAWIALSLRGSSSEAAVSILTVLTAQGFAIVMQIVLRRALLAHASTAERLRVQLAERTRLEDQLLHSQRMEAVGTLAAGLAHDMNNVLASIASFAGLLDAEVASPEGRADLDQIVAQSLRGAELTRGLLAFSRRGQYRKQTIRLDDIVLEVLPILVRTLPRTIEIRDRLHGGKVCVDGDPIQLGQVLINLGINAADAMDSQGTFTIAADIVELGAEAATALAVPAGRYARLEVTDGGCGMDEATRRRVFEPFFTTKAAGEGTGLGLSTVWGIVHAHDGAISVRSSPGAGATFSIHLPVTEATTPTRSLPVIMRSGPLERMGTVLIADDEPAVRAGTARILQRMGLTAIQAADGEDALQQYREHQAVIDLVILDMGMPGMGGAACFRKLREISQVPVLIATGYAVEAEVQKMIASGAALIEKPFPSTDLIREVTRLLKASKSRPG